MDLSRLDKSHVGSALFAVKGSRHSQVAACNVTLSTEEKG